MILRIERIRDRPVQTFARKEEWNGNSNNRSTTLQPESTSAAACACAAEGNRADRNREFTLPPSSVSRRHARRRPLRGTDMDISSLLRKEPLNKLLAPNHTQ
jgi:hypothetical protein